MYFDILVVIPLEEEFKQFISEFPPKENYTDQIRVKYSVEAPNGVSVLVVLQDEMGYWGATSACAEVLHEHQFGIAVCLGIAGALSSDVSIGDVCYSGTIIDTVSNGKIRDTEEGGEDVALASEFLPTPKELYGPMGFVRVMPEFCELYETWQCQQLEFAKSACSEIKDDKNILRKPKTFSGDVVCGLVAESTSYKEKLKAIQRKVLAIETESGAVARACSEKQIPMLAVRGISDFADASKNQLEEESEGAARIVAARNASSFFKLQLGNDYFVEYIQSRRPTSPAGPSPQGGDVEHTNVLANTQQELLSNVEAKLKELNQSYRTIPNGTILPLPRAIPSSNNLDPQSSQPEPVEIRQAIELHKRVLISIPRVFPDRSLPWLVAQNLSYEIIGDKQLVPIVIEGSAIRPPRGEFQRLSSVNFEGISKSGGELVFIIDNFNPKSNTNSKFLADQIAHFPDARVIILCNEEPTIKDIDDLSSMTASKQFRITNISFSEVTAFLSKHFSLPNVEAEVLAFRLRKIFRQFKLPAHPTFFAGIPQEMLASILNANRRGELIQLAVDGYLTFLVIEDKSKARLSRTTRGDFLRRLVRELKIEKRNFSYQALVDFAQLFFDDSGFPTDASTFCNGFFDKGILIMEQDRVEFGIPFIEAYHLAKELCTNSDDALSYFDIYSNNFDLLTFDLYAEMCADERLVSYIVEELESLLPASSNWETTSELCQTNLMPEMVKQNKQVSALQRRLEIAKEAVNSGSEQKGRKQRLLDVAERVNEEVSDMRRVESDREESDEFRKLDDEVGVWALAVILLGQGSEKISGETKDRLAQLICTVGAKVMSDWSNYVSNFDFVALKSELTKPDHLVQLLDSWTEIPSSLKPEQLIGGLVDIIEMHTLSEPIHSILNHVSEEARHDILLPAISKAETTGPLSLLIASTWLGDIEAKSGRDLQNKLAKDMPSAPFLRTAVVTHYIMRVYWSVSDKSTRLQLLDTANKLLKPTGRSLPVGEIRRQIEQTDKSDD